MAANNQLETTREPLRTLSQYVGKKLHRLDQLPTRKYVDQVSLNLFLVLQIASGWHVAIGVMVANLLEVLVCMLV